MKQLVDYMVAALVLLLCCPLLLYIAIRIRMQGAGSVFYQQERLGKGGVPFRMVKFRTMVTGAEDGTPLLAVSDDQRVTAFGRTLRKHHLDELPQFWNVLMRYVHCRTTPRTRLVCTTNIGEDPGL